MTFRPETWTALASVETPTADAHRPASAARDDAAADDASRAHASCGECGEKGKTGKNAISPLAFWKLRSIEKEFSVDVR